MLTFDITNDFIVGDRITKETLNKYSKLPHKIKAGLFLLCVEGSVQASINLAKYTINKYDFVTLVPSNFIQFHEISDDARFYFAGFSSEFMTNINFNHELSSRYHGTSDHAAGRICSSIIY